MKKIILLLSLLAAFGIANTGCISQVIEEEEVIVVPPPGPEVPEVIDRVFRVTCFAGFSSKINTYAHVNMEPNNPVLVWSNVYETAELNVGIFLKGVTSGQNLFQNHELKIYSIGNSEAGNTVTVTTDETNGVLHAYYPYQNTVNGTILSYKLNNVQDQSVGDSLMDRSLNSNMLMISEPTSSFILNGGEALNNFKNVFSILRFRVNMSSEMPILKSVKKISFYIANKQSLDVPLDYPLAGNYTIDLSKAPGTPGYTGPVFSSKTNMITAQLSNSQNITTSSLNPSVWMVVNPVTLTADDRLVAIVELDTYTIISSHEIDELKPNTIHDIHIVTSKSNTISDNIITHYPKEKASNCYVIPSAGICQIPLFTTNGQVLRGSTVEWLWASKENSISNFDIKELIDPATLVYNESATSENDNYVRFRVGTNMGKYTKGNVILALKNASGGIVWTWHIWITDDLKDVTYPGGTIMLDRNIGALASRIGASPVDNYGFVYQWGRKDPFFGGDGIENETTPLALAKKYTLRNGVDWVPVNTIQTSDFANLNPMTFISNPTTSTNLSIPADWLSVSNPNRWSENSKTDHDPCPSGYKVPGRDDLKALLDVTQTSYWYFKLIDNWHWEYAAHPDFTAWPTAGMRQGRNVFNGKNGAQLLYSGTAATSGQCFYWTSSPINIGGISGGSHRIYTAGNVLYSFDEFGDNADAYPIRCVKE